MSETALYDAFVDKFKPKLTTDDCYTPELVYEAVAEWVASRYGVDRASFLRPFWPGADYERTDYPPGAIVVDNPPFSILSSIIRFYTDAGVRFFLFAPALTLFTASECRPCYLPVGVTITYANGAEVGTSFVTNLDDALIRTEPTLYRTVDDANKRNLSKRKGPPLPKYAFPDEIVTAAMAQRWCKYGVEFHVAKHEAEFVRALDSMRAAGKGIYGSGWLLSERAAAERAAAERAERAAAESWPLSDREREIVRLLGLAKPRPAEQQAGPKTEQISLFSYTTEELENEL